VVRKLEPWTAAEDATLRTEIAKGTPYANINLPGRTATQALCRMGHLRRGGVGVEMVAEEEAAAMEEEEEEVEVDVEEEEEEEAVETESRPQPADARGLHRCGAEVEMEAEVEFRRCGAEVEAAAAEEEEEEAEEEEEERAELDLPTTVLKLKRFFPRTASLGIKAAIEMMERETYNEVQAGTLPERARGLSQDLLR
jgi:hypothetical protein